MHIAIVNLILSTPNIRPMLLLEDVTPIDAGELPEINIVELGRALADRGHDVVVYVGEGFLEDGDVEMGSRLRVRGVPTLFKHVLHPAVLPFTPDLSRDIVRDGAEVIQSAEFHHPETFLASRAATRAGVPLVVWQEIFHRMRAPGSWYEHGYEFICGSAVRGTTSRFVLRTTRARKFLESLGIPSDRIGPWVPTGVDTNIFRPRQTPLTREGFGFGNATVVILTVARLSPDKRVDLAIRAVALLRKSGEDVALVVRGSGPQAAQLRALAKSLGIGDYVHFPERVPRDQLVDLYNLADIFLLTSQGDLELLPFAALQATACGLPVVTVRAGCMADIVQDGVNGRILDEDSPEGVAAGLRPLVRDSEARHAMGRRARRRAEEMFDTRVVARRLEEVYKETLAAG